MQSFIRLIETLDNTTKTNAKIEALAHYFSNSASYDILWAVALLTGRRPKRCVTATLLKIWAAEMALIPMWLFEECYHTAGDLAETISLLLSQNHTIINQPLHVWMQQLIELDGKSEQEKKNFIIHAWKNMDFYHLFIFNKIITGGLRIGVSQNLVVKALSKTLNMPENAVTHRISGDWQPQNTTFEQLFSFVEGEVEPSKPYPFYLAYPIEAPVETLGNPTEWQAEWKWDGLRGQIIKREGEVFAWSRGEELITEKFPELQSLKNILPNGTVIDGEILAYKNHAPLPFQVLQTRIGRKNISNALLKNSPVVLFAYDILEWNNVDIRNLPLCERRRILSQVVTQAACNELKLSPTIQFHTWEQLTQIRLQSRAMQAEGLMLKKLDSPYETGRKRGKWWKWKIDPYTIDGVLIYAQKGHGRRADLYTDFTFAVWDKDKLVPFAKAYSGLTDKELVEIDQWVKKNTLERFGPVRSVPAHWVFELAFEGINRSTRHKSGVALRFPRIIRWRKDKSAHEADHLETLKKMIAT